MNELTNDTTKATAEGSTDVAPAVSSSVSNPPPPPPPAASGISGYPIASLVLALLSLFFGFITGIPAIITGMMGYSRTRNGGQTGREFSLVGIILGSVTTIVSILAIILLAFFIVVPLI